LIIFHLSFAIFHFPFAFSIPTYSEYQPKWKMKNGKSQMENNHFPV